MNLDYYKKNAKEAFNIGFTEQIHYEIIGSEVYEVHAFFLPTQIMSKLKNLKRYFKFLDRDHIPAIYKRRKHYSEYIETALVMLQRVYYSCRRQNTIVAGSKYINPCPWAVFGPGIESALARHQFSSILEIASHYIPELCGDCTAVNIHFRKNSDWVTRFANKFEKYPAKSANFWVAVALLLLYDLIQYCGPDCGPFFELFTNDIQENINTFDFKYWEHLRYRVFKLEKRFNVDNLPLAAKTKRKPLQRSEVEVMLLSDNQDLAFGEKTYPTLTKSEVYDYSASPSYASKTNKMNNSFHMWGIPVDFSELE